MLRDFCAASIMALSMMLLGTVVVAAEEPDQTAEDLDSSMPTVEQRRAHYRAVRQQVRLERLRKAGQAAPQPQPGPLQGQQESPTQPAALDQSLSQAPDLPLPEPAQAPGPLAEMGVSFMLYPQGGAGSPTADQWWPRVSGVREGAVSFKAKVEGRDGAGRPVDISPEWVAANPSAVEVTPSHGNAVTITVRGEGASNLTVRARGISRDIWILARPDQGNALRVQISQ